MTVVEERAGAPKRERRGASRIYGVLVDNRYYRNLWASNQLTTLTMQMQIVAQGYLAFVLTGSAAVLGIVAVASGLPQFLLSPLAGVLADRMPRRQLLIIAQAVLCVIALALGLLIAFGWIQWWHLAITGFLQAAMFTVNMPARQSYLPSLVRDEDLPAAIALNNSALNASRIVGPTLAGMFIGWPLIGITGVFFIRAFGSIVALLLTAAIPIRGETGKLPPRGPFFQEITAGLRYIRQHEVLFPLFVLAAVAMMLGNSYQTMLPVFALGVLDVGATGQGIMATAVGIGALTGSLAMAYFSYVSNRTRIQTIAGIALGFSITGFAVAAGLHAWWGTLVFLVALGLSNDIYSTTNNTLIILNSEKPMYGRVMSVYMMTWSLVGLASGPIGWVADHVGAPTTMAIAGLVLVCFVLWLRVVSGSRPRTA